MQAEDNINGMTRKEMLDNFVSRGIPKSFAFEMVSIHFGDSNGDVILTEEDQRKKKELKRKYNAD